MQRLKYCKTFINEYLVNIRVEYTQHYTKGNRE